MKDLYRVEEWRSSLPKWQQWAFAVLSFVGQRERGFELFGYYRWAGLK